MAGAIDIFFKLGEKATKGDPLRKANYDYYMFWIIFCAFLGVFIGNIWDFYLFHKLANLGWALFGAAVMWFQYFGLKQMYDYRNLIKKSIKDKTQQKPEDKKKDVEDMLKEFK